MNHSQILIKLSAPKMVETMQEDLSRAVLNTMISKKNEGPDAWIKDVLPAIMIRWNHVLNGHQDVSIDYTNKTWIALAVGLHKLGLTNPLVIKKAEAAIEALNKGVVLSDDFARQTDKIKSLLKTAPKPLSRKPALQKSITFYREGDVISFEMKGKYYAGYIHEITGNNEAPVVEWYDWESDHIPTLQELGKVKSKGRKYNDGSMRISRFAVYGLKSTPDPAHQVQLLGSGIQPPSSEHLEVGIGAFAMSDIFVIQKKLDEMFE